MNCTWRVEDMANLKFPFEIRDLDAELNKELLEYFKGERTGFVQVGPEKYFFPQKYRTEAERYYNFEARRDDVWIVTFPRSGTTFTQELVWLIANNLDFATANSEPLTKRFPFFEFPVFMHPEVKAELMEMNSHSIKNLQFIEELSRPGYEALNEIPVTSRRFIKTHFPFSLLPPSVMKKQCKVIYVLRENTKDVAVSFYHLNRLFRTQGYTGDFERYWSYFERALNPWMPYMSHVKEALSHRGDSNVLFLKYEDMLVDLEGAILKISKFLDYQITEGGIEALKDHLAIENFRNNPQVIGRELEAIGLLNTNEDGFVRNGGSNGGRRGLSKEFTENPILLKRSNRWLEENSIKLK